MHSAADRVGVSITEIGTVIAEMLTFCGKVARASEDQSQATAGIARNIDDAFRVVGEIAGNIQALAQAAATTEELATSTMAASSELSSQSGLLTHEIQDLSRPGAGKIWSTRPAPAPLARAARAA